MTEELPTTPSRDPPPLPPNHPSSKKSSTSRPPPPKPPQMSHHPTPPPPPSKLSKQTNPNTSVTVISAQPITQAHPFYLTSRPVSENHDETTLPPRAKPPPIMSKPIPPKPQNYVNFEIPADETETNHPVRPSQPPVSAKTDDKLPHRPTSPPSDIFLSNILVKEAGDKQTNKLTPTRNPPPPRPSRTAVSETADSEEKPPVVPPPVATRKLSFRKAPPPPVATKAVYPADSDETPAQPEVTKTAEPIAIKPTPRRNIAPPVSQDTSPSKPEAPAKPAAPAPKIDKPQVKQPPVIPPVSKPIRPGNPKPSKPTGPPTKRTEPSQDPTRRAPSLPPRPGPGHPLYKYVCAEPHGFALIHFPTNQPDMLSISKGEFLMLIEKLDEYWYYCANEGDEEGIVLANNIKVVRRLPDEGGQIISADKPFAVAINNYSSSVDGDLSFKKGDVIFLIRYLSETWLEGECEETHAVGMFPKSQIEIVTDLEEGPPSLEDSMVGPRAKVIFDFPGDQPGDLPLLKDGFVYLLEKLQGGWYKGALASGGEEGIFPEGFIEVIEELPDVPTPEPVKQPEPAPVEDQGYTGRAIYDFEGGTDGDLSFNIDDVITNITSVNSEWLRGHCSGLVGIFPVGFTEEIKTQKSPVKKKKSAQLFEEFMPRANALYDYNENVSGDLCFKAGDVICLLKKLNTDWYEGELNGVVGNLPAAFVEIVVPLP